MNSVLVDTSVWIQYFHDAHGATGDALQALIDNGLVSITGIVIAELFAGARNKRDRETLEKLLEPAPYLEPVKRIWRLAGEFRGKLMDEGLSVPLPDMLLAATAIHYDVELFSLDKHFKTIASILPLKLLTA